MCCPAMTLASKMLTVLSSLVWTVILERSSWSFFEFENLKYVLLISDAFIICVCLLTLVTCFRKVRIMLSEIRILNYKMIKIQINKSFNAQKKLWVGTQDLNTKVLIKYFWVNRMSKLLIAICLMLFFSMLTQSLRLRHNSKKPTHSFIRSLFG